MKRIAAVAVMAALMSVSLVAVATAHTVKHDSTVTFQVKFNGPEADTFEGKVRSDSDRCVANREVRIKREDANGDVKSVAEDTTNADGEYSVRTGRTLKPGTYYAVVRRKALRENELHTHVCKRAASTDRVIVEPAP
jgi:flagellar hook assembly protein FlgD